MIRKILLSLTVLCTSIICFAQDNSGEFHGNFDLNMQSYQDDELIGAEAADEIILSNSYLNINYTKGKFTTGLRYESYLNALADYDPEFKGNGIPYRYATYSIDGLEITAGNYYEQLGSGLIFRSYEEKSLGIDNAMDGVRLKYSPLQGMYLKTFIGKSRAHFTYADGIFRGIDGEININNLLSCETKTKAILGGSFVSRYQERSNLIFKIPQNVSAYASRLNIIHGVWNYYGEYAYKINDPSNLASILVPKSFLMLSVPKSSIKMNGFSFLSIGPNSFAGIQISTLFSFAWNMAGITYLSIVDLPKPHSPIKIKPFRFVSTIQSIISS